MQNGNFRNFTNGTDEYTETMFNIQILIIISRLNMILVQYCAGKTSGIFFHYSVLDFSFFHFINSPLIFCIGRTFARMKTEFSTQYQE